MDPRAGMDIAKRKFSAHSGIEHQFAYHSIAGVVSISSEQLNSQGELTDRPIFWQLIKQGTLG